MEHLQPFGQVICWGLSGQASGVTVLPSPSNRCTVLCILPKHVMLHSTKWSTVSHFAKTFTKAFWTGTWSYKNSISSPRNACNVLCVFPKCLMLHSAKWSTFSHFAKTFAMVSLDRHLELQEQHYLVLAMCVPFSAPFQNMQRYTVPREPPSAILPRLLLRPFFTKVTSQVRLCEDMAK